LLFSSDTKKSKSFGGIGMDDLKKRLEEIGEKFGVKVTPENMDKVMKETWEKYRDSTKKTW